MDGDCHVLVYVDKYIMDKLVTLFGYLSSYVVPSRRSGNTDGASGSGARNSHSKSQDNSTDSGFNSTKGGLLKDPAGEQRLDRTRASAFTEPSLDTLRGEVREIQTMPPRCETLENESAKTSGKTNIFSGNSPSVLPPVNTIQSPSINAKSKTAFNGVKTVKNENSAGANVMGLNDLRTEGTLLRCVSDNPEEMSRKEMLQRKEGKCKNNDLRRSYGLPNIFSNAGRSFVQVNQLAVFDRASFRKNTTCAEHVAQVEKPVTDDGGCAMDGRKSRLKMGKVKRKSTKTKSDGYEVSTGRQKGQHDMCMNRKVDAVQGHQGKDCDEPVSRPVGQEGRGATATGAEESEKMRKKSKNKRPGTAFGRWIKKRSNVIAPAPLDDSTSDASERIQAKGQGLIRNNERLECDPVERHDGFTGDVPEYIHAKDQGSIRSRERSRSDAPRKDDSFTSTAPGVKTVFVNECNENVLMLVAKEETYMAKKSIKKVTCNDKLTQKVSESQESSLKGVIEETTEEVPGEKVTPYPLQGLESQEPVVKTARDEKTCSEMKSRRKDELVEEVALPLLQEQKSHGPVMKAVRKDETSCYAKTTVEAPTAKVTPPCLLKVQEGKESLSQTLQDETNRYVKTRSEDIPAERITPPYPVKRDLLKETLENVSLAGLNDDRAQKPKVTPKKQLKIKQLGGKDEPSRTRPLHNGSEAALQSSSQAYKKIFVKQRDQTSEKMCEQDYTSQDEEHDALMFDVKSENKHDIRMLSLLNQNQEATGSLPKSYTGSPGIKVESRELQLLKNSRVKKQGASSSARAAGNPIFPCLGPNHTAEKPSSSKFSLLPNSEECASTGHPTADKPKWDGGKPCLPSIKPDKKQIVEDFLEKRRRKQQQESELDQFEGWGEQDEPEELKRILERPVTARLPSYPPHWEPLPNERPPGRGGSGYFLGMLWKRSKSNFLSDSSSEGTLGKCSVINETFFALFTDCLHFTFIDIMNGFISDTLS